MGNEISKLNNSQELTQYESSPKDVVKRATEAAKELQKIVDNRGKKLVINGKQYLFFEDWQTLGRFDHITAKVIRTEEIQQDGKLLGFNAYAVALKNGVEVSAAEAECCFDEPKWKNKPRFQLRSMAQTRACSKALRNCLAFIAVLANYEPTPAEEMDDINGNNNHTTTQATAKSSTDKATDKQIGLIKKQIIDSHLIKDKEKERLEKKVNNGLSKSDASNIISWWLGDSKKGMAGERAIREQRESLEVDQELAEEEGNSDFDYGENKQKVTSKS